MDLLLDKIPLDQMVSMILTKVIEFVKNLVFANPIVIVLALLGIVVAIFCQTRRKPIDKYGYSIVVLVGMIVLKYFGIFGGIFFLAFAITFVMISFILELISIGIKHYKAFLSVTTLFMVLVIAIGVIVVVSL
jgi:hypothetical protein